MTFPATRRTVLTALGATGFGAAGLALRFTPASAQNARLVPNAGADQSAMLAAEIAEATARGEAVFLAPGSYRISDVDLPDGSILGGVPGRTILLAGGAGPILRTRTASHAVLSGLVLDGEGMGGLETGLVHAVGCARLTIEACELRNAAGNGIRLEECGGRIAGNLLEGHADAALFSTDAVALDIAHNTVRDCGNNGILVWTSRPQDDGSRVADNHIHRIRADAGGTGEYGNGVNVFRAANVSVSGNRIDGCAFSAVRNNGGANSRIMGNTCTDLGEMAIYAEFAFDGAVITDNLIDGAASGISITNFNDGGRLAVCANNVVRNITRSAPTVDLASGIAVEADASVTGNVVETVAGTGIGLGWGPYLRDVTASGNTVRNAEIGIAVSVSEGAGAALVTGNLVSGCPTPLAATRWRETIGQGLDGFETITHGLNRIA